MPEITVSDSVCMYCKPTLLTLRLFGGAPLTFYKEKECFVFKKSKEYIFYSYGLALILVGSCIFGLWCDATACGNDYSRVREEVDICINTFDMAIVFLSVLYGILMSPVKLGHLFGILQCLNKVNAIINEPLSTLKKDRKFSIVVFSVNYTISIIGIILETSYKLGEHNGNSRLHYLRNYGGVVLFFTVISTQQLAYWNIIRFVKARFRSMNRQIELVVLKIQGFESIEIGRGNVATEFFGEAHVKQVYGTIGEKMVENCFHLDGQDSTQRRLRQLMTAHEQIYLCVNTINKFFDYPILLILINCIIEMIISPWIFITKTTTVSDKWLLIMWIFWRATQLFLLIEPIQGVLVEHGKTGVLILQLMKQAKDGPIRKEVELFLLQYQMYNIDFTSVDMISLKRTVYAAVSSVVTTYLVILIQFNK